MQIFPGRYGLSTQLAVPCIQDTRGMPSLWTYTLLYRSHLSILPLSVLALPCCSAVVRWQVQWLKEQLVLTLEAEQEATSRYEAPVPETLPLACPILSCFVVTRMHMMLEPALLLSHCFAVSLSICLARLLAPVLSQCPFPLCFPCLCVPGVAGRTSSRVLSWRWQRETTVRTLRSRSAWALNPNPRPQTLTMAWQGGRAPQCVC